MSGLSVIILSKNIDNLIPCVEAVRKNEPEATICVVADNGLDHSRFPINTPESRGWVFAIGGASPFIYSRNANIGIDAAGDDDVVLLNDDALLQTTGGLTTMQRAAQDNPQYGLIGSTCNNVGNRAQFPRGIGLRDEPRMVCFVCVLIPRSTIDKIGLLDEIYAKYAVEDDDYCLRTRMAGLKIGIHDGCYCDHGSLTSSYRGAAGAGGDFRHNLELFKKKWGMDNWGNPA